MLYYPITIRYDEECKAYVSYCPALRLYSQALTKQHAYKACLSAIEFWTKICFQRGILIDVLVERNAINLN